MNVNGTSIGKKILVVDDDADDRELFTEALTEVDADFVCYGMSDGKSAIEGLQSQRIDKPDLIFLDLNMPVMNGWEFLKTIRAIEIYSDIPVIIHTTSSNMEDVQKARQMGANCFLTKPDDFEVLKKVLSIVVEKITTNAIDTVCKAIYRYLQRA